MRHDLDQAISSTRVREWDCMSVSVSVSVSVTVSVSVSVSVV